MKTNSNNSSEGGTAPKKGRVATCLSFSLYPKHVALIRMRERELNLGKSKLLQALFDIEEREGLLRKEMQARFDKPQPAAPAAQKGHHDNRKPNGR